VVVATLEGSLKGAAQAEILVEDAFPLDNRAFGVFAEPTQTWILLVGEGNYFLEQLLTSLPGVIVNVAPEVTSEALPQLLASNHVIIFNGVQPPPLQRGNFLLIHTVPQDNRLQAAAPVVRPQVLHWDRQHPLLQFVDLTDLRIETALALQPQGGARSLIDGPDMSLLSLIEEPSLRILTLAFDLMQSDLPLRVAFPVLISNLLSWFDPHAGDFAAGQVQAGMPYTVFFETPVERVVVQDPQGKEREYPVQGNPWIFADAQQIGVYIMRYGESKRYLTVSLLDETESDINPAQALPALLPADHAAALQSTGVVETPLWPYLLLGAVAIVCGEWYVWCRDF